MNLDDTLETLQHLENDSMTPPHATPANTNSTPIRSDKRHILKCGLFPNNNAQTQDIGKTWSIDPAKGTLTPNSRKTKRTIGTTDHTTHAHVHRSKLPRYNRGETPEPMDTLSFVVLATCGLYTAQNHVALSSYRHDTETLNDPTISNTMDLVEFIKTVTACNPGGNTAPRTSHKFEGKYQRVTLKATHQPNNSINPSTQEDASRDEDIPYFLKDKPQSDRNDWFSGRRHMANSAKQTLRRSYVRQAYHHNLLTPWATSHEGMPPWLQGEELNTRIFELKARAGRELMECALIHLDEDISEHNSLSATSLALIEAKLTPSELLASRKALQNYTDEISDPVKQNLSVKRESLRRNQPSVTDLVTMKNKDKTFPKKSNPPPQKKRPASAALGRPPTKRERGDDPETEGPSDDTQQEHHAETTRRPKPHLDTNRGGGYHHYDQDGYSSRRPRRGRGGSRRGRNFSDNQDFQSNRWGQGASHHDATGKENRSHQEGQHPQGNKPQRGQTKSRRPRKR